MRLKLGTNLTASGHNLLTLFLGSLNPKREPPRARVSRSSDISNRKLSYLPVKSINEPHTHAHYSTHTYTHGHNVCSLIVMCLDYRWATGQARLTWGTRAATWPFAFCCHKCQTAARLRRRPLSASSGSSLVSISGRPHSH